MVNTATSPESDHQVEMTRFVDLATQLSYQIVDVAGFFEQISDKSKAQMLILDEVRTGSDQITEGNAAVADAVDAVLVTNSNTLEDLEKSLANIKHAGQRSQSVATWVQKLSSELNNLSDTIQSVTNANQEIADIASQINMLAINAKIEAARAGNAGSGFAVVAEAVNDLSQKTSETVAQVNQNITHLTSIIGGLKSESTAVTDDAKKILTDAANTDTALNGIAENVRETHNQALSISEEAQKATTTCNDFTPLFQKIIAHSDETTREVVNAQGRVNGLVDGIESIVQTSISLGGASGDARFITKAQEIAAQMGEILADALMSGRISETDLFTRDLAPIPGTDPQQFNAPFVKITDAEFAPIQEAALLFDPSIVFCAAVTTSGFLPTHNKQFSQIPGPDVAWNTANCRNRRIFDDRVGLKAGQNKAKFLLQVYRRDMGGGQFVIMKDLSAPIFVKGRHWGGVRLAFK